MVGETRIIAFGPGGDEAARDEFLLTEEAGLASAAVEAADEAEFADELSDSSQRLGWIAPVATMGVVAIWTGVFVWANRGQFHSGTALSDWTGLVTSWAIPVLLICVVWLLFMRNSRREAMRFGDAARILSDESSRLETRLVAVNRELSLAREFIAAQSRDLDALGRFATERLSRNADRLQDLVQDNSARIEAIGNVSEAALTNMEKLSGQLPVIASSAKDITNNIANAGRTAHAQLSEMVNGFDRLNDFGQASERQVLSLRGEIDHTITEFSEQCEKLEEFVTTRFAALAQSGEEFRTTLETHELESRETLRRRASELADELALTREKLDSDEAESLTSLRARLSALRDEGSSISRALRESESRAIESWRSALEQVKDEMAGAVSALEGADTAAVEAARARLTSLAEEAEAIEERIASRNRAFDDEIERRAAQSEASEQQAIARLSERFAALDAEIAERQAAQEQQGAVIAAHSEAIAARIGGCEQRMAEIASLSASTEVDISASIAGLAERLVEARAALAGTDTEIATLTDSSVRLLELIQAASQLSREQLPEALTHSDEHLSAVEGRVANLSATLGEAGKASEGLSGFIDASTSGLQAIWSEFEERQTALDERQASYEAALIELRSALEAIELQSDRLAKKAQGELSEAIEKLKLSTKDAMATIGEEGSAAVSALANRLGKESGEAIDKAMHVTASEVSGQLEQAAAHAAGLGREAAGQLRDQLAKVNELVGNLERRVTHARERAEEQVDNDFSRRVALITESLNSNAIDIARVLSTDIADTAWAAYLRGDRGIFTRRAVSLLESGEARAIAQAFERDNDFREHVSRYIHDFEAILRQVLSTRDGHALGVTLLSSDMGKLYVALAQGIERLRD